MTKIKLTFPYPYWPLIRQTPLQQGKWGNYDFIINPDPTVQIDFDYWVVFNFLLKEEEVSSCRKHGAILITGEPSDIEPYSKDYVSQFDHVITSQLKLDHHHKHYLPQGLPWFVNKSYDELSSIQPLLKSKRISIISSIKQKSSGHRKRLEFVMELKSYFGDAIDLFGRGINDFQDKWHVLAPYKYSVAIENTSQPYYFTEKIMDCYLAYTFPIYFGCTNIYDYFEKDSLSLIDIDNFSQSVNTIEQLINDESHFERVLPLLIEQRKQVLNCYNLFPLIVNFIERFGFLNSGEFELRKLTNLTKTNSFLNKIKNRLKL